MPNDIYKPVTEDSLREFYQQIQPYLNADVPVIANKYDKASLYSETERIVGQWVDGKPLYQKTIDCGAMPNATTKTVASGLTDENVKRIYGFTINSTGVIIPLPYVDVSSNSTVQIHISYLTASHEIRIMTGADRSGFSTSYVTIQYTKTTDQPISIGADTDYSTTEKVVGTWIDGKPVYQKTIEFNSSTYTDASKRRQFTCCTVSGVDMIVNTSGQYIPSGAVAYLNGVTFVASDPVQPQYSLFSSLNTSTNTVTVYFASAIVQALTSVSGYVTLQYTKVTT